MSATYRSARQTYWQSHLDKAQVQGLSVRAYARREGLSEASLYAARRQPRAKAVTAPSPKPAFAAVRVSAASYELLLPGGIVLRLPDPPSAQWLAALAREFCA